MSNTQIYEVVTGYLSYTQELRDILASLGGEKVYIAGPITCVTDYKRAFNRMECELLGCGAIPLNPTMLPDDMEHKDYMKICLAMIDVCDLVILLPDWEKSKGARLEVAYADELGKMIIYPK